MIGAEAFAILDPIADTVNPLLALVAIVNPWLPPRWPRSRLWTYYVATILAIAASYALRWLNTRLHFWAAFGLDFSSHTAFAVATSVSIAVSRRSWRFVVAAVVAAYLILIVVIGYHTAGGVVTSAVAAVIVATPAMFVQRR